MGLYANTRQVSRMQSLDPASLAVTKGILVSFYYCAAPTDMFKFSAYPRSSWCTVLKICYVFSAVKNLCSNCVTLISAKRTNYTHGEISRCYDGVRGISHLRDIAHCAFYKKFLTQRWLSISCNHLSARMRAHKMNDCRYVCRNQTVLMIAVLRDYYDKIIITEPRA